MLQVWHEFSQPHLLEVEPFSPNSQAAAARSATVHDPVHLNIAAQELKAVVMCLKEIRGGVYQGINDFLKAALDRDKPLLVADLEEGRNLPETKTPCVRNHMVTCRSPSPVLLHCLQWV